MSQAPEASVVVACHKPYAMTIAREAKRRADVESGVAGRRGCWAAWLADMERECGLPARALFQIGRLDKATTGLLLATNDGDLAYGLTRRGACAKRYVARVGARPTDDRVSRLRAGVALAGDDFRDGPVVAEAVAVLETRVKRVKIDRGGDAATVEKVDADVAVTVRCGQKRVVRKLLAAVGLPVLALRRVAIGDLVLGAGPLADLPQSAHRRLDAASVEGLWAAIGGRAAVARWKAEDRAARDDGPGGGGALVDA